MHTSTRLPDHTPIAITTRGSHPENIHHGSFAVVNADGELLASSGDVDFPVFTRSSLKPFQAMPTVARLGSALSDEDIAVLCASHNGEPMHVDRVQRLLASVSASESALACGTHTPYFYAATGQTPPVDGHYSRLQHNCSGKHTGMLMLARSLGQSLKSYLDAQQATQLAIRASVAHFCGVAPEDLIAGVDGCSAPNYALPLRALALGFARLTKPGPDAQYGDAPHRIARAMSRHPELVSGTGRNDLVLMQAGRGDWVSKVGADGVQAIASFCRGVAIAAKCSAGALPPLMVAMVDALNQLGWTDAESRATLAALIPPPLTNVAGLEVGEMLSVLRLAP